MTQEQYYTLAENFADYAHVWVSFKEFSPQTGKNVEQKGRLKGIGTRNNAGNIIISWVGSLKVIHYSRVSFPKL